MECIGRIEKKTATAKAALYICKIRVKWRNLYLLEENNQKKTPETPTLNLLSQYSDSIDIQS